MNDGLATPRSDARRFYTTVDGKLELAAPEQKVQVVRTRSFKLSVFVEEQIASLVYQLYHEKFTGKLCVNFSQGGVASVVAEEKLPNEF